MITGLASNTLYLAIDPSFKGLGIAGSFEGVHKVRELSVEGSVKDPSLLARHMFELTGKIWTEYLGPFWLPTHLKVVVMIEMPPPRSMFSAGLFFLVGGLVSFLRKNYPSVEIYSTSALTIKSIHGSRKATKEDSIILAEKWAKELDCLATGFGMTHNQAEAFILLIYLYQTVLGIEVIKDGDYSKKLSKPRFSKLI